MKKTCKADSSSIRKILDEVGIAEGQTDIESYKCLLLIAILEETFGVEFPIEYFHERMFSDVNKIFELISSLQGGIA